MNNSLLQQIPADWDEPGTMWHYHRFVHELERLYPPTASCVIGQVPATTTRVIGHSEKGEPIYGFLFGEGPNTVSLVAGAHADEPAGPNTLYRLTLEMLRSPQNFEELFTRFRFLIIPHVNPDGDAANAAWMARWPDLKAFLTGTQRELPGRDIEFGYPDMRPENRSASAFWNREGPADLHMSLHGMQFSEGYLLLINDEWEQQTREWRIAYDRIMKRAGLEPHDHDRKGEKGFNYMGPGFTSTPKGLAMRRHFLEQDDRETADKFHLSSMEFHLQKNPEALCMVTELPLFLVAHSGSDGVPHNYLALKEAWKKGMPATGKLSKATRDTGSDIRNAKSEIRNAKSEIRNAKTDIRDSGSDPLVDELINRFAIRPLPLAEAMRLQLYTLESALNLMDRR